MLWILLHLAVFLLYNAAVSDARGQPPSIIPTWIKDKSAGSAVLRPPPARVPQSLSRRPAPPPPQPSALPRPAPAQAALPAPAPEPAPPPAQPAPSSKAPLQLLRTFVTVDKNNHVVGVSGDVIEGWKIFLGKQQSIRSRSTRSILFTSLFLQSTPLKASDSDSLHLLAQ